MRSGTANRGALAGLFDGDGWVELEQLIRGYDFATAQDRLERAVKAAFLA